MSQPADARLTLVDGTPFVTHELEAYVGHILDAAGVEAGDEAAVYLAHPDAQAAVPSFRAEAERRGVSLRFSLGSAFQSNVELRAGARALRRIGRRGGAFIQLHSHLPLDESLSPSADHDAALRDGLLARLRWRYRARLITTFHAQWGKQSKRGRWTLCAWPTRRWAEDIYPHAYGGAAAWRALGLALLDAVGGCGPDAGRIAADHLAVLRRRAARVNEWDIDELWIFDGGGTDLRLRVADRARWMVPERVDSAGRHFQVNLPTNEIFTTPDPDSVEGSFVASQPVVLELPSELGIVETPILGVRGRLEGGRLTDLRCQDLGDEELHAYAERLLQEEFSESAGLHRVGEIGLATRSGPLAGGPRIFLNPDLDENRGVHLGFGLSYSDWTGGAGTPTTGSHRDVVIGCSSTCVLGRSQGGPWEVLIELGQWRI